MGRDERDRDCVHRERRLSLEIVPTKHIHYRTRARKGPGGSCKFDLRHYTERCVVEVSDIRPVPGHSEVERALLYMPK